MNWRRVRDLFQLDPTLVFLNAMVTASHPRPVRRAIKRHRRALDHDPSGYTGGGTAPKLFDQVAMSAAAYLGLPDPQTSGPNLIALTNSTTAGLALLYNGLQLDDGVEILMPQGTLRFTTESIDFRGKRDPRPTKDPRRFTVRTFPLFADCAMATVPELLRNIENSVSAKTRVLALTWVLSDNGLKIPLREIGELVHNINSSRDKTDRLLLCIDGVHGFGVEDLSFDDMGCDFFVAGGHKWMFGPRGTGIICGKEKSWNSVVATIPTFRGEEPGKLHSPGGLSVLEHQWALAQAFDLHLMIGKERIQRRTWELARLLKEGLSTSPRVTLLTPMDSSVSSGVVCCDVDGIKGQAAVEKLRLAHRVVASKSATEHLRFSPCIFNSTEDIERAVDAVKALRP